MYPRARVPRIDLRTDNDASDVPTRPVESDLSTEDSRAVAGRTTYGLERADQSPRRTWGSCGDEQLANNSAAAMTGSK
jgi:hypothetical protein